MLGGIVGLDVEADQPGLGAEEGARARRKISEPGAHGQDHVGAAGQRVRRRRAGDADRAEVERMVRGEGALAGLGLGEGDRVGAAEAVEGSSGTAIDRPAAGDDERRLGRPERRGRGSELGRVGRRAADAPDPGGEEGARAVEGLRLNVLAERERHRPAGGRVGQHRHRPRECDEDLLGAEDAVEIARDGAKTVIGRDRAVGEILDLLEHRVRPAGGEDIPRQQEHGQAVDMRQRRRRHHVGGPRPDRGRAGHHPPPRRGLGEGDRGVGHRLLVMGTKSRQALAGRREGLAEPGDIAVAEDRPDAGEERQLGAIDLGPLGGEIAHQRLGHGQTDRVHGWLFLPRRGPARGVGHGHLRRAQIPPLGAEDKNGPPPVPPGTAIGDSDRGQRSGTAMKISRWDAAERGAPLRRVQR